MKGQKEAVVEAILACLPAFNKGSDIALMQLTSDQLEDIKSSIALGIQGGLIEYSKDASDYNEVRTYARSMVMNHLKKARELNGGVTYGKTITQVKTETKVKALSGINMDLLPDDLKEAVRNLV